MKHYALIRNYPTTPAASAIAAKFEAELENNAAARAAADIVIATENMDTARAQNARVDRASATPAARAALHAVALRDNSTTPAAVAAAAATPAARAARRNAVYAAAVDVYAAALMQIGYNRANTTINALIDPQRRAAAVAAAAPIATPAARPASGKWEQDSKTAGTGFNPKIVKLRNTLASDYALMDDKSVAYTQNWIIYGSKAATPHTTPCGGHAAIISSDSKSFSDSADVMQSAVVGYLEGLRNAALSAWAKLYPAAAACIKRHKELLHAEKALKAKIADIVNTNRENMDIDILPDDNAVIAAYHGYAVGTTTQIVRSAIDKLESTYIDLDEIAETARAARAARAAFVSMWKPDNDIYPSMPYEVTMPKKQVLKTEYTVVPTIEKSVTPLQQANIESRRCIAAARAVKIDGRSKTVYFSDLAVADTTDDESENGEITIYRKATPAAVVAAAASDIYGRVAGAPAATPAAEREVKAAFEKLKLNDNEQATISLLMQGKSYSAAAAEMNEEKHTFGKRVLRLRKKLEKAGYTAEKALAARAAAAPELVKWIDDYMHVTPPAPPCMPPLSIREALHRLYDIPVVYARRAARAAAPSMPLKFPAVNTYEGKKATEAAAAEVAAAAASETARAAAVAAASEYIAPIAAAVAAAITFDIDTGFSELIADYSLSISKMYTADTAPQKTPAAPPKTPAAPPKTPQEIACNRSVNRIDKIDSIKYRASETARAAAVAAAPEREKARRAALHAAAAPAAKMARYAAAAVAAAENAAAAARAAAPDMQYYARRAAAARAAAETAAISLWM